MPRSRTSVLLVACLSLMPGWPARGEQLRGKPRPTPEGERPAHTDCYGDPLPDGATARLGTVRFRHGGRIDSLAYSPDGTLLASSSQDGTIRLWDPATGREVRRLAAGQAVFHVAWSPDGRTLAAGGQERAVQLWDVATGTRRRELEHLDPVMALGFRRDGKQLLTAGVAVRLWDVAIGREVRRFPGGPGLTAAALSPDGRTLVTAGQGRPVVLWDTESGAMRRRIEVPGPGVDGLAFSPDGKTLALDCLDGMLRLVRVADGRELRAFARGSGRAWCVAYSPDGRWLACGGPRVPLRVWEVATGVELPGFHGPGDRPCALAFSPDGNRLASAGEERVIRFAEVPSGRPRFPAGDEAIGPDVLQWSPDGRSLFTQGEHREKPTVEEWSLTGTRRGWRFALPGGAPGAGPLAISPDGRVAAAEGAAIVLCEWRTGRLIARLREHAAEVAHLAFSEDGRVVLAQSRAGAVRIWAATGQPLEPSLHAAAGGPAVLSPDGRRVAVGEQKRVRIWEVGTGVNVGRIEVEYAATLKAVFTPDGQVLVTGSLLGEIQLWRVDDGEELRRFGGGEGGITSLAVSADGHSLATGHPAGGGVYDIRVWERASGQERRHFQGHQGRVRSLAFSPDGRLLASASEDRTALLWDLARPSTLVGLGSRFAGDDLWIPLAEDAGSAYEVLLRLEAHPAEAVALLRRHLRPVPAVDARSLARWIAELDSDQFATRERASRELDRLGELAVPALRAARASGPTLEMRLRIQNLLDRHDRPEQPTAEGLRQLRAVEVLERVGTAEARRLLEDLAGGAAEARLTQEAKASLGRLARRAPLRAPW